MKKLFLLFAISLFNSIVLVKAQSKKVQLKFVNIDNIEKNKEKGHPIIYMEGNQWKEFIKDAVKEKYNANNGDSTYSFKVVPLGDDPFVDGVIMFGKPCPPGCKEDQFGLCRNCHGGGITPCSIQGLPGHRHCAGICTSTKHCRMFVASSDCGLIKVGCHCE